MSSYGGRESRKRASEREERQVLGSRNVLPLTKNNAHKSLALVGTTLSREFTRRVNTQPGKKEKWNFGELREPGRTSEGGGRERGRANLSSAFTKPREAAASPERPCNSCQPVILDVSTRGDEKTFQIDFFPR